MRFPICTFDLTPKRRFKRIANVLRRHWPIANDISHMTALEILAQGLGYRDFHDVLRSSKNSSTDAPVPTLPEVRDNVSTAIFQYLKSSNTVGIDDRDIERLVLLLPLHELLAFQSFRQGQTANVDKTDSINSAVRSKRPRPKVAQGLIRETADSPSSVISNSTSPLPSRRYLSVHELQAITEAVHRRAILRDSVLFSMMHSGIRQAELLRLKTDNIKYTNQGLILHVPVAKSRMNLQRRYLTRTDGLLVASYFKESGLSDGDCLFPSAKTVGHPMTSFELKKIFRSWLLDAQIDPTGVSFQLFRRSIIVLLLRANTDLAKTALSFLTSHYPPEMLRYYSSLHDEKPGA
ncbi:tyrosine-type recombinase/integrase [Pseudomonas jessenii]|uniref:tyrosine-type recombinase/integrase n=1 Tax=Pseudomonas jessenii TaxID=77298 RepID=UPI0030C4A7A0